MTAKKEERKKEEPKFYNPKFYGLFVKVDDKFPYDYNRYDYKTTDEKKVKAHKELLQSLEKKENDRLAIIDSKTSQIITFTGIIFSALSLFIPILLEKIADPNEWIRFIFLGVLFFSFLFYILTIHNAIRNYNILKFIYSNSDPNNVIKYQEKTVDEFTNVEIQDLLYAYNQNLKTNNDKASNLIYAYRAFRAANFFTGIMGILICGSLLFAKTKDKNITINPIKIQTLDSTANVIIKAVKEPYKCGHDSTADGKKNSR